VPRRARYFALDAEVFAGDNCGALSARAASGVRCVAPIVVVDDNQDTLSAAVELLTDAGYSIRAFENGATAWQYLSTANDLPCLVITDWMMPRMDGSQLLGAMKAHRRLSEIPVLVLTGTHDVSLSGATVLLKPVPTKTLLAAIESLLTRNERNAKQG
jgi:DNA-binding response OmpR family regulator